MQYIFVLKNYEKKNWKKLENVGKIEGKKKYVNKFKTIIVFESK